jgi:hypothetical protein
MRLQLDALVPLGAEQTPVCSFFLPLSSSMDRGSRFCTDQRCSTVAATGRQIRDIPPAGCGERDDEARASGLAARLVALVVVDLLL